MQVVDVTIPGLTKKQADVLFRLSGDGPTPVTDIDGRTYSALRRRGYISAGKVTRILAKGLKILQT